MEKEQKARRRSATQPDCLNQRQVFNIPMSSDFAHSHDHLLSTEQDAIIVGRNISPVEPVEVKAKVKRFGP